MKRRLSLAFGALIVAAALAAIAAPRALAISATYGTGAGFCHSVTSAGYDLGANYDNVWACGPTGEHDFKDKPFEDADYGFQCTELANRFLWDAHHVTPVSGNSLVGGNFVATVHAEDKSIPVGVSGTTALPAPGDIISMWEGSGSRGQNGSDSHVAVVTGVKKTSSGWAISVMEENATEENGSRKHIDGSNTITVSATGAKWSYNSGYYTSFDWLVFGKAGFVYALHGNGAVYRRAAGAAGCSSATDCGAWTQVDSVGSGDVAIAASDG